jgi:predicted DNA-binding transcriptional regulator AlpA
MFHGVSVSTEKLLLNLSEASALLGLTPSQLYGITRTRSRTRQSHPIPVIRLGKRIAFRREALEQWILALENGGRQ